LSSVKGQSPGVIALVTLSRSERSLVVREGARIALDDDVFAAIGSPARPVQGHGDSANVVALDPEGICIYILVNRDAEITCVGEANSANCPAGDRHFQRRSNGRGEGVGCVYCEIRLSNRRVCRKATGVALEAIVL